jgi:hypothetical protein
MKKRLVAMALMVFVVGLTMAGCETFDRFAKDMSSELGGGLYREIIVRNIEGEIIEQYEGKFDVVHDGERIKFIDEQGKLHLIYLSEVNTVTITEK